MLSELFAGSSDSPPIFQQLLKVRAEQVHFLDFWRAFSKATHLLTSLRSDGIARDEGLAMELETVRDGILRLFEAQNEQHAASLVALPALLQALHTAAAMSRVPAFWNEVERRLRGGAQKQEFCLEDLSEVMLAWLQEAIAWQYSDAAELPADQVRDAAVAVAGEPGFSQKEENGKGTAVFLHIYDVSQEDGVRKLNKVLAHKYSPLKLGGVFHAGVEVNGLEWSYGMSQSETLPGLSCVLPKQHPSHRYRQSVKLNRTKFTAEDIAELISQLAEEYPGHDYHLLRRNCCHFADDFCQRIGAGRIPGWVHRLARIGANVDTIMHRVMNRRLLPDDSDDD